MQVRDGSTLMWDLPGFSGLLHVWGRQTLQMWKAWDGTEHEGRYWVDVASVPLVFSIDTLRSWVCVSVLMFPP